MMDHVTIDESFDKMVRSVIQSRVGGKVERCHTIPHHGSYSVAQHSWGVAMLMFQIWPEDFPRLAAHCLVHDVPEAWMGDLPATVRRYVPGLRDKLTVLEDELNREIGLPVESELCPEDQEKLKACDRLEFWLWCRDQLGLGNRFAAEGMIEMERHMREHPLPERAKKLFKELSGSYVLPRQAGVIREMYE